MGNIIISILGVFIGAVITYYFNMSKEKKNLKNKIYVEIYERTIQNIDKTVRSANELKQMRISSELEKQYKHPVNSADVLDRIDSRTNELFRNIQLKMNDLIEINLFFSYHTIPLDKYKELIEEIENETLEISKIIKSQKEIYNSTKTSTGYIKIENEIWEIIIENENNLEHMIDEYMDKVLFINCFIQRDYYVDLLRMKKSDKRINSSLFKE